MAVIKTAFEVTIDGVSLTGSSRLDLVTLSDITKVAYCVQDISLAVAPAGQLIWTTANGGITTFTRGLVITDQDIYIEFRTDNATPEFILQLVEANSPFWFGAKMGGDTTESLDGVAQVDGTDFDDVDRIEIQNASTSAATVSVYLFT